MQSSTRMALTPFWRTQSSTRRPGRDFRIESQPWEAASERRTTKRPWSSSSTSRARSLIVLLWRETDWGYRVGNCIVKTASWSSKSLTSRRLSPLQTSSEGRLTWTPCPCHSPCTLPEPKARSLSKTWTGSRRSSSQRSTIDSRLMTIKRDRLTREKLKSSRKSTSRSTTRSKKWRSRTMKW